MKKKDERDKKDKKENKAKKEKREKSPTRNPSSTPGQDKAASKKPSKGQNNTDATNVKQ